jgi:CAAX prenyl protease-like protein
LLKVQSARPATFAGRSASLPYVGPFVAFLVLLAVSRLLRLPPLALQAGFVAAMLGVILILARPVLARPNVSHPALAAVSGWRPRNWASSLAMGVFVFVLWIAPDMLFPGYRHHWLFQNSLLGYLPAGLSAESQGNAAALWLRAFRAVAIVPLVEELFWRAWMMRWLIAADFEAVPLGTWSARAFWVVAILFASEHGSYWDVGLAAGILYNWWMLRTKSLVDLVLAHAVTNACLSIYVVWAGKWEYWS